MSVSTLEIAHILFLDLVGYSRLPMDAQREQLTVLNRLLRSTEEFRDADEAGDLLRIPTGDGMALVFFRNAEAPARCALALSRMLRQAPLLELRMGVNTGPVYRVEDINTNQNVAGGGINMAQRVMDCGDAGHILVSRSVAEMLGQLSTWAPLLHDLGECEVKHCVRLRLFNLFTADAGNAARPSRLAGVTPIPATLRDVPIPTVQHSGPAQPARETRRLMLVYKRGAPEDEHLLLLLEQALRANGYEVFIDRHLAIGVEWAREIERQIRASDVIVPLLSAASLQSEMVTYEIKIAHQAAQEQEGRPRLLPVRIGVEAPYPDELASILDPVQYALWGGPEDDPQLVQHLLRSLRGEPSAPTPEHARIAPLSPSTSLEAFGGAVPLGSAFYLERPTDAQFLDAVGRRESLVLVKGARQMGKTSLLARGLEYARKLGARTIHTDFQKFTTPDLETPERFFMTLGEWIADQLDLDVMPEDDWNPRRSASVNFERYLRREALEKIPEAVVWGLDEVDRLFTASYASDVFGLFRSWHNERSLNPNRPWSRLTLAIAYATEAHLFITDINQSPFNVGIRLSLEDFTFEQVKELNRRHGSPLGSEGEASRFFRLTSGHPYLTRRGLHELTAQTLTVNRFEALADRDEGPYGDHLRRLLVSLSRDAELSEAVRGVLVGRPVASQESFYRLRSAGVLVGDIAREARMRCQLYTAYLERHLL